MLLTKGISVERSLAEISDGERVVLLVIFTFEHRHIFRDTAVAYAEPSTNIVDCFASELGKDDGLLRGTDVSTEQADQNRALQGLMKQFHTCFAWSREWENCQSRSTKYPPKRFKKHFFKHSSKLRTTMHGPSSINPILSCPKNVGQFKPKSRKC